MSQQIVVSMMDCALLNLFCFVLSQAVNISYTRTCMLLITYEFQLNIGQFQFGFIKSYENNIELTHEFYDARDKDFEAEIGRSPLDSSRYLREELFLFLSGINTGNPLSKTIDGSGFKYIAKGKSMVRPFKYQSSPFERLSNRSTSRTQLIGWACKV